MAWIRPRARIVNGLAQCVDCWGEYPVVQTVTLDCGHHVCDPCEADPRRLLALGDPFACSICTPVFCATVSA
jgi:hypothetical protein